MNAAIFTLGAIVVIIGLLAAGYTVYDNKTYFFGAYGETSAVRPYATVSIPLIVVGLAIMLISALVATVKTTTKKSYVESPVRRTKVVEVEE